MSDKKKYIITSITLGAIAASSGLLIGVTNLLTKDQIAKNEENKINNGIKEIFDQNTVKVEGFDLSEAGITGDYKYVEYLYEVKDENDNELGCAFVTSGSNNYGKISLIIGFDAVEKAFLNLSIVVNEQTYATTLVDNYINPLNNGKRDVDDVKCGATYGAKLVRDMIDEAEAAVEEFYK